MKTLWIFALAVLAFAFLAPGCSDKPALPSTNSGKEEKSLRDQFDELRGTGGTVEAPVVELTTGTITSDLSITGELVPQQSVIVKPLMDGTIAFVRKISVGDLVRKGEVIAKIDDRDVEDEIKNQQREIEITQEAIGLDENELEQKKKDLEFSQGMVKDGFMNESELRRSELELHRAEIAVRQSMLKLEQAKNRLVQAQRKRERVPIVAPIDGMVVQAAHLTGQGSSSDLLSEDIASRDGTLVGTGTELFGIVSQGDFLAQCAVNGKDKARIQPGQKARLAIVSHREFQVAGEVAQVAQLQDAKSHAYKVWISVDDPDPSFTSGLFVRADIELAYRQEALVLPKKYVKERDGKSFIQRVRDGRLEDAWVETGIRQGQRVEIVSGAAAGDQVVASDRVYSPGQSVKAVKAKEE